MITSMVDRLAQPKSYGQQYNNTSSSVYKRTRCQSAMGRFRTGEDESSPSGIQGRPTSRAESRRESRVEIRPESRNGSVRDIVPTSAKNTISGRGSPVGAYANLKAMVQAQQRPNSSRADQRSMRQRERL